MKKIVLGTLVIIGILGLGTFNASAHSGSHDLSQTPVVNKESVDSGALEGKLMQEKLRSKKISCDSLKNDDFDKLGDYYMDQMTDMMGKSHKLMDSMMNNMMGADKSEEMHIVVGKRFSGCDTSVKLSADNTGFMSKMMSNMMGNNTTGNWSNPDKKSLNNFMMNFSYGAMGILGWLWMVLWWVLIIVGIVALIRWINNKNDSKKGSDGSALDILKKRYVKGEITKHEFESMKKEIE